MCAYGMSVSASAYGCAYAHTCICVKAKGSVMPPSFFMSPTPHTPSSVLYHRPSYLLLSALLPFLSHLFSLSLFYPPPPVSVSVLPSPPVSLYECVCSVSSISR